MGPLLTVTARVQMESFDWPRELLEREVARVQELIEKRQFYGASMADSGGLGLNLTSVSHVVTKFGFEGDELRVTAEVLDTDKGKDLVRVCDRAVAFPDLIEVRWGLVGCGSTKGDEDRPTVQDDFVLSHVAWWGHAKEAVDGNS